jgi:aspartyl-tRNA(Asn)/glutamyl-tRNA(Gln) amidotransferase subunit A
MASPRLSGLSLAAAAELARSGAGSAIGERLFRKDLKLDALAELPDDARGDYPLSTKPLAGRPPRDRKDERLPSPREPWSVTSSAMVRAYREGTSPRDVVDRSLTAAEGLAAREPSLGPLHDTCRREALLEAEAAGERYARGNVRGPLDGIPFAVKEEIAVRGLACRGGTAFLPTTPSPRDAFVVDRLRKAGAIAIGTTPMTEFGMTPNGANPFRRMPRNPHAFSRAAGGSSTGSGVAVATGILPFTVGVDGGGSIRIPAAINGVFGLKPTWGRVSRHGQISQGTVAHTGPLASSTKDIATVLEVISGRDPDDPETWLAPPREAGSFVQALGAGVKGLVIAIVESEWNDAAGEIASRGFEALSRLEREGAKLVRVSLPCAAHAAAIGYLTIALEARAMLKAAWENHRDEMSHDLQVSFSVLNAFRALEFTDALRLREGLRRDVAKLFGDVDLIALPTTATTAPKVSERDMASGFADTDVTSAMCRFNFLGNLTGLPAISCPVGRDGDGLPIGLQLVGDAWDEATVFAAAAHLERIGVATPPVPLAAVDLLG